MKISELIILLQKQRDKYGDIEVYTYPYDGQLNPSPIKAVDVSKHIAKLDIENKAWVQQEREQPIVVIDTE